MGGEEKHWSIGNERFTFNLCLTLVRNGGGVGFEVPLITESKTVKYLGINLARKVHELDEDNY